MTSCRTLSARCCLAGPAAFSARPKLPCSDIKRFSCSTSRRSVKAVCFKDDEEQQKKTEVRTDNLKHQTADETPHILKHSTTETPQGASVQSVSYGLLAVTVAATSVSALLLPRQTAQTLFAVTLDEASTTVMRSLGAMLTIVTAVNFSLQSAAARHRLSADVHRRLNAGLMAWGAGVLVIFCQAISVQNTALAVSLGTIGGATLLLSGVAYAISKGGVPLPNVKSIIFGVASLPLPRSPTSAAYSAICVLFLIKTWLLLGTHPDAASPLFAMDNTVVTTLLFRLSGVTALLSAVAAFCLRDSAEQHNLDMPTSRALNLGLAVQAAGQAGVMAAAVAGGSMLPSVVVSVMGGMCVAIFSWCMYNSWVKYQTTTAG